MSIIKLREPWCFNIGDLTEDEIEELYSHFVSEENYHYLWSHADPGSHVGIDWRGTSNYFGNIESFDEYDIEDNVAIYTIEQLRAIIAEHLAKQHVEPESVTKFVVGKWYKWFQKDHGREQKGKCATLYDNHFEMKPWICHSSEYVESGMFNLRDAESIEIIEDLSEIQDLLPEGHPDKWVKTEPKSERYLATMKFFEQLREPERSESIANYDEDYSIYIPKSLESALSSGFCWYNTEQESDYWEHIHGKLLDNTYFQEEILVFGKYKVGDIVVSLKCVGKYRKIGEMFAVLSDSSKNRLYFEPMTCSTEPESWRLATLEEIEAYNQGIRNVADIKPKDCKVVPEYVECVSSKTHHYKEGKIYTWPDTITEEGKPNKPDILKGGVWEFKPSTKEAYDEQQEKLKMEELLNEAKRRYPTGTKVRAVLDGPELTTEIFTLTDSHYWASGSKVPACYTEEGHPVCLHLSGKWAEIVKEEPKPTEIKPAKGMHVRCLKENSWSDGKTKIGQIFVIEDVDWSGDMWVNNHLFAKERLGRGEFELLPDYKEEPWIAQVGDWVYVLDRGTAYKLKEGEIRKCVQVAIVDGEIAVTEKQPGYWLKIGEYRKATQEEIDSVTKPEKKDSIFEQLRESMFDSDMAWHKLHSTIEKHKPQQDELVIYKPKQTGLVEPGAVSASASTTNLIIKSNSKYL